MSALSAHAVGLEFNRSADWLLKNRHRLEREEGFPKPTISTPPLAWSAVQLYAWFDRDLPPALTEKCVLIRAAIYIMEATPETQGDAKTITDDMADLDKRFG